MPETTLSNQSNNLPEPQTGPDSQNKIISAAQSMNFRRRILLGVLFFGLLLMVFISMALGASSASWAALLEMALNFLGINTAWEYTQVEERVIQYVRMPRVLLGCVVGAALACSGACMQALFRNPLADPGLIGIGAGASLGAVTWIVLNGFIITQFGMSEAVSPYMLPISAFVGALAVTFLVYRLAHVDGRVDIVTLLLAGIACNAIAGACIGLLTYWADDNQLRQLTFWSMGSLAMTGWDVLQIPLIVMGLGTFLLILQAKALNAILLGEREAFYLGWNVDRIKRYSVILVALVVGAAVCVSGGIGFIGLVVPHCCRLALGPDHRWLMPCAALGGAILTITADTIARLIIAPAELPIGIITASIGGPFFLGMLLKQRKQWTG